MDKVKEVERLLGENKIVEAQALIKEIVSEKMSDEDRGEGLVNIATIYLDIMNKIDVQYANALKEALASLKDLNVKESGQKDEENLRKVRESLK